MNASRECYALLRYYEQLRLVSYPDPKTGGAPWTIGLGATGPDIGPGLIWTREQAEARLVADVGEREEVIEQAVDAPLSQGQFDALVSIVFNVGYGVRAANGRPGRDGIIRLQSGAPSTLLRSLNAGLYDKARAEFAKWISPGSAVEYGLRRRRRAEQGLWDGLTARDAIAVAEAEFPLARSR